MPKSTKPSSKPKGNINTYRVLRNKDPKKKKSGVSHKDGETFKGGKNVKGRPKAKKKNVVCRQMGKATVCFDKSKPKRSDKRKVRHKKK